MKNYFVVRLCNKADSTVACPVSAHETEAEAQKEFFRQCGLAVDSTHIQDTVMMVTAQGFELRHETFAHSGAVVEEE